MIKTMIRKSRDNCKKKPSVSSMQSRSSKITCETHGKVYSREPCVKLTCSGCNKTEIPQNKNPRTDKEVFRNKKEGYGMGDKFIDLKTKRDSCCMLETNHIKGIHSEIINRPNSCDDSVDTIPTRLHQGRQTDTVKSRILSKDPDSNSAKQMYPGIQRTTWDCILREQNNDLVRVKVKPKSKLSTFQDKLKSKTNIDMLNEQDKEDLILKERQNNRNVQFVTQYESVFSYNNKADENIETRPVIYNADAKKSSDPRPKLPPQQDFTKQAYNNCSCSLKNPILTLDILVKELREKLHKQGNDDDLQRIILDMENALSNFPVISDQQNDICDKVPIPAEFKKEIVKKFDIKTCKSMEELHLKLEENCQFLQDVYEQLHEAGKKHREEKEKLTQNLAECRRLLAISKTKEKDYETTIKEMKLLLQDKTNKGDQNVQAIHELTQIISRLQEENKCIPSLKASQAKLMAKFQETVAEKDRLNSELQLFTIEKEKLTVLMKVKDKELEEMKKNFEEIKTMFGNYLNNTEALKDPDNVILDSTLSSVWDKGSDDNLRPICSSPTSSIPGSSPSPYSSWQAISSINQKPKATIELKQGIRDLFDEMKKQTKELNPSKLLPMPTSYGSGVSDSNDEDGSQFKHVPKLNIPPDILESDLSS